MAIYRLSADIVRRSEGRTVTAAAAYRAGERIVDQRTGLAFDYRRRQGVIDVAILAPADAPAWMRDRVRLWNAVEAVEKRKDAQLARDIELALPHELSVEQRRDLVHRFVRAAFVDTGMVADVALHAPSAAGDERNHHAHILLTLRRIEGDGFGPKERAWNDQARLEQWRAVWAELVNDALEIAGDAARVDHRSLAAQGIERRPQIHLGRDVIEMRRRGIATERAELAAAIGALNLAIAPPIDSSAAWRPAEAAEFSPPSITAAPPPAAPTAAARAPPVSLFRKVAAELARRAQSPAPQPRRRREETKGAFRLAAKILRRAAGVPVLAEVASFLADTLDWFQLWHNDAADELDGAHPLADPNRLFPQP